MFGRQVRRVVNRTVAEPRLPIRVVFEQRRLCTSISSVSLHAHRTTIMNSQRSIQIQAIRWFSSRGGRRSNTKRDSGFQLDALPFSISPEQALESFHRWAKDDQGLSYLISSQSIRIGAHTVPSGVLTSMRALSLSKRTTSRLHDGSIGSHRPLPFTDLSQSFISLG
jgi:hypothetical protein